MALFLVANLPPQLFFERRQQVEGNIGGLEALRFGMGDVVDQRAVRGSSRCAQRCRGTGERSGESACEHARGNRLRIALDARELSCNQDRRMRAQLKRLREQRGCVDVCVAVDLSIPQEACVFESRNEAQNARLLAELQMVLEADKVVAVRTEILLAKLHDGVRPAAGLRVGEPDWLHGTEA